MIDCYVGITSPSIPAVSLKMSSPSQATLWALRLPFSGLRGVAANGNELFDLDLLDISSKQTRHLLEATPSIVNLSLSPDGGWLAFQQITGGNPAIFLLQLSESAVAVNLTECESQSPGQDLTDCSLGCLVSR